MLAPPWPCLGGRGSRMSWRTSSGPGPAARQGMQWGGVSGPGQGGEGLGGGCCRPRHGRLHGRAAWPRWAHWAAGRQECATDAQAGTQPCPGPPKPLDAGATCSHEPPCRGAPRGTHEAPTRKHPACRARGGELGACMAAPGWGCMLTFNLVRSTRGAGVPSEPL